jgi:hypothetical protein
MNLSVTVSIKEFRTRRRACRFRDDLLEAQKICQSADYSTYGPEGMEHAESLLRKYGVTPHEILDVVPPVDSTVFGRFQVTRTPTVSHITGHEDKYPSELYQVVYLV